MSRGLSASGISWTTWEFGQIHTLQVQWCLCLSASWPWRRLDQSGGSSLQHSVPSSVPVSHSSRTWRTSWKVKRHGTIYAYMAGCSNWHLDMYQANNQVNIHMELSNSHNEMRCCKHNEQTCMQFMNSWTLIMYMHCTCDMSCVANFSNEKMSLEPRSLNHSSNADWMTATGISGSAIKTWSALAWTIAIAS